MSRKMARECAFKLIYEIPFHKDDSAQDRLDFFSEYEEYSKLNESDIDYLKQTVNDCFTHVEEIDEKLTKSLKNWTIARLPKVSLAILRLSLSEMNFGDGIPYQISINEAVELAKKFGDDDTPSFINGVLADVIK